MREIMINKDQLYTIKELAEATESSWSRINLITKRLKIVPAQLNVIRGTSHCKVNFYAAEDAEKILQYIADAEKQKELIRQKRVIKEAEESCDLEALKKAHPLVQDVRCFNLNWWPDVDLAYGV